MATFTRDWDEATPTDDNFAYEIDDYNRYLRVDTSDRLKAMIYGFTAGENDGVQGFKTLVFKQQAAAPATPAADIITFYCIDDGANAGIYAIQEDGYTKQVLKKVGSTLALNVAEAEILGLLTNNTYLTAVDNAGTGTVDLIKANASDVPVVPDGTVNATSAAPTADAVLANKKYVDDQIAFTSYTVQDSESQTMLKAHAYLTATDGFVAVRSPIGAAGEVISGYVGTTSDPAGAGDLIQRGAGDGAGDTISLFFAVKSGEYFEITDSGSNTPDIRWMSRGTLSKPVDQD